MMIVSCNDIVTLTADITGDLTGHTVVWDQISGTPVIWLENQDQISVMFQQPTAIRDDKVFRFYIDKDTPYQVYYDTLVTAVPTERHSATFQAHASFGDATSGSESASFAGIYPLLGPAGSEVYNASRSLAAFNFNEVPSAERRRHLVRLLQLTSLGEYTEIDRMQVPTGTSSYFNSVPTNTSFKIVTEIDNDAGATIIDETVPFSSISPKESTVELAYTDESRYGAVEITPVSEATILQVLTRELVPVYVVDTDIYTPTTQPTLSDASILETITRELVILPELVDTYKSLTQSPATDASILEIKKLDYSSLG